MGSGQGFGLGLGLPSYHPNSKRKKRVETQLLNQNADFGWDVCGYKGEGSVERCRKNQSSQRNTQSLGAWSLSISLLGFGDLSQCPDQESPSALPEHLISCSLFLPCLHSVKCFFTLLILF